MSDYTDGYLKFDNQAQAESTFATLGVTPVEGGNLSQSVLLDGKMLAVDVLFGTGKVQSPTGETGQDGDYTFPIMADVPGYHVNVRYFDVALPEELVPYSLNPDPVNPKCRFA